MRTAISYDKGAFWHTPKVSGAAGKELHISLEYAKTASGLPTPQTTKSALGIILANGWDGDHKFGDWDGAGYAFRAVQCHPNGGQY